MTRVFRLLILLVSGFLLWAGCGKSSKDSAVAAPDNAAAGANQDPGTSPRQNPAFQKRQPGPPVVVNGDKIDVPKAEKALATSSEQLQATLANVRYSLRYTDYKTALATLQKVAADPSLTDDQRASVNEVMQQVQQAAAKPAQ